MADTVYWINTGDNTIRAAPLAGGGSVDTLYGSAQGVDLALGIAINSAAGRIHWTNYGDSTIRGAPLAGGGTVDTLYDSAQGVTDPVKVAIDPAAGRLYWTGNYGNGEIRRAPLAGGTVDTLYGPPQGVFAPTGVAIDPAGGRIYWSDSGYGTILGAPLAGGGTVNTLYGPAPGGAWGPPVYGPTGVAIDPAAGRIYWANYADGTIRGAPLAGGGTVNTLYGYSQGVRNPTAVAIDPTPAEPATIERFPLGGWLRRAPDWAEDLLSRFFPIRSSPGRIYWPNADDTIRAAPLAGGGTVDTLYGSAQGVSSPSALAVLRAPLGTGAPAISWSLVLPNDPFGGLGFGGGGGHSGPLDQRLSCSRGMWAADLPGSFLYRAPQSFAYQWRLNGTDIGGATAAAYTPNSPGTYTCRVTATNRAGSAAQTSATVTVS